jgi:hypothetical protein
MDILWTIAVIALVLGVLLLLAGYLVPTVPPDAVRAGWGLIGLGVVLIVLVVLVDALDDGAAHRDADRDLMLGMVLLPVWRLLHGYRGRAIVAPPLRRF